MISLQNLIRQHIAIKEEVNLVEEELSKGKTVMDVSDILFHINKLTKLLKIHLLEEDIFLYPDLKKCQGNEIQSLTNQYEHEMRNLVDNYTIFKCSYPIESRINAKIDQFLTDAAEVVKALKDRLIREENELYHLIRVKNL